MIYSFALEMFRLIAFLLIPILIIHITDVSHYSTDLTFSTLTRVNYIFVDVLNGRSFIVRSVIVRSFIVRSFIVRLVAQKQSTAELCHFLARLV